MLPTSYALAAVAAAEEDGGFTPRALGALVCVSVRARNSSSEDADGTTGKRRAGGCGTDVNDPANEGNGGAGVVIVVVADPSETPDDGPGKGVRTLQCPPPLAVGGDEVEKEAARAAADADAVAVADADADGFVGTAHTSASWALVRSRESQVLVLCESTVPLLCVRPSREFRGSAARTGTRGEWRAGTVVAKRVGAGD